MPPKRAASKAAATAIKQESQDGPSNQPTAKGRKRAAEADEDVKEEPATTVVQAPKKTPATKKVKKEEVESESLAVISDKAFELYAEIWSGVTKGPPRSLKWPDRSSLIADITAAVA
ncbi:hypothetical protein HDU93_009540 [Gonapodya sp. JEL0774]|nr:hypothetical protein HDU93_009540 [Gonapodya sp. JEL0774]